MVTEMAAATGAHGPATLAPSVDLVGANHPFTTAQPKFFPGHGSGLGAAIQSSQERVRELNRLRRSVADGVDRVAASGQWPTAVADAAALIGRVPNSLDGERFAGFDAGVACALDLIPRHRQTLSAKLHGAYTAECVEQVRAEMTTDMDPDSETCWWLAACAVCHEGVVTGRVFLRQIEDFEALVGDRDKRLRTAHAMAHSMVSSYRVVEGVAHSVRDGGMQGAYIGGHEVAVQFSDAHDAFFVGTFRRTLAIPPDFEWGVSDRSGPVHGSDQFVKAADEAELGRVLAVVSPAD